MSILFDLADLEDMNGHYAESEAILRRIVAKVPRLSGPLNNLAWLLATQPNHQDEALELVNRAIAIDGPDPDLLNTRSLIYLAQAKADRALTDLQEVAATKPAALTYFHLAIAQSDAGNRAASQAMLQKARTKGLSAATLHPIERLRLARLVAEQAQFMWVRSVRSRCSSVQAPMPTSATWLRVAP